MIIVVDDYGVTIEKDNNCFVLSSGEQTRKLSPFRVSGFHVHKPATITTPAILLAAEHNIPLLFFDSSGHVEARLWQPHYGSLPTIRYNQLLFAKSPQALPWIMDTLQQKLQGQLALLNWCANRVEAHAEELCEAALVMEDRFTALKKSAGSAPEPIRIAEAHIAKAYWSALSRALEKYSPFDGRSRQPAQDPFNALLNYGYGMLYSLVETAAITAGLDPSIGILHTESYNRPAFVFDSIEPFRPWVDRFVVEAALRGELQQKYFARTKEGVRLIKAGKQLFIPTYNEMMQERVVFNGRRIKRKDQIQHFHTAFAQFLLDEFNPDGHA